METTPQAFTSASFIEATDSGSTPKSATTGTLLVETAETPPELQSSRTTSESEVRFLQLTLAPSAPLDPHLLGLPLQVSDSEPAETASLFSRKSATTRTQ